jgi:hypothetical protein
LFHYFSNQFSPETNELPSSSFSFTKCASTGDSMCPSFLAFVGAHL